MNSFPQMRMEEVDGLGPKTDMKLHVSGTVTLPLHLQALDALEDPVLQTEIVKEAARIALSERLGGFDKMHVTAGEKHGHPTCEVRLDLTDLCCAIANIKHAYEHAMTHLLHIQQLVDSATKTTTTESKEKEKETEPESVLASINKLLQQALESPGEAPFAAAIRQTADADTTAQEGLLAKGNDDGDGGEEDFCDGVYDPVADGYAPLLDPNDMEQEKEEEDQEEVGEKKNVV